MKREYRPCVLGVLSNAAGEVLVAERAEPRGSWQFPQGGIDAGESPEEALRREIFEELGLSEFTIISRAKETVRYEFPTEFASNIAKKFRGQEQVWFHIQCRFGALPDLSKATDKEFVALEWIRVQEVLNRIVGFKRNAYQTGLQLLGLI